MSNYIRREDAVDMFNRAVQDVGILDADDIETVFEMLSSADVVQVVRCRDCREFAKASHWCESFDNPTGEDDFCSYGERRE